MTPASYLIKMECCCGGSIDIATSMWDAVKNVLNRWLDIHASHDWVQWHLGDDDVKEEQA